MSESKLNWRTQFDSRLPVQEIRFSAVDVQPNAFPSISQMVKTRAVGGNLGEYEMDGIESDAPFESEYLDFFDMQDEVERMTSQRTEPKTAVPQEAEINQQVTQPPSKEGE